MTNKELAELRNKAICFNQFMIEYGGFPDELLSSFKEANAKIIRAYEQGDMKVLKAASTDIDEQISRHMSAAMLLKLQEYFGRHINVDLEVIKVSRQKRIDKIVKAGKIKSHDEYELISSYVDQLSQPDIGNKQIEILNRMLLQYHNQNKYN